MFCHSYFTQKTSTTYMGTFILENLVHIKPEEEVCVRIISTSAATNQQSFVHSEMNTKCSYCIDGCYIHRPLIIANCYMYSSFISIVGGTALHITSTAGRK